MCGLQQFWLLTMQANGLLHLLVAVKCYCMAGGFQANVALG